MKIFHKTSCITCKKTIAEVERIHSDIDKRDFFKDPFFRNRAQKNSKNVRQKPSELLRKRDKMYKELDLENNNKTDIQIIRLMVKHPGLILRPIVLTKQKHWSEKQIRKI